MAVRVTSTRTPSGRASISAPAYSPMTVMTTILVDSSAATAMSSSRVAVRAAMMPRRRTSTCLISHSKSMTASATPAALSHW